MHYVIFSSHMLHPF